MVRQLNDHQVLAVMKEYATGATSYKRLAVKYGVAESLIRDILTGRMKYARDIAEEFRIPLRIQERFKQPESKPAQTSKPDWFIEKMPVPTYDRGYLT